MSRSVITVRWATGSSAIADRAAAIVSATHQPFFGQRAPVAGVGPPVAGEGVGAAAESLGLDRRLVALGLERKR